MNCMPRRAARAIVVLTAAAILSLASWSLEQALAQQPRPGLQKGPGGGPKAGGGPQGGNPQAGNVQGGNGQGGDAEGGGRSPAQPHIARARQLINQAQD